MRSLSSAYITALDEQVKRPAIFVELSFGSGFVRAWSGVGPFMLSGDTYTGVGTLGSISVIRESSSLQANGVTLGLSGISSSVLAAVLAEQFQGRAATIRLGLLDESDALIGGSAPVIWSGRMDTAEITASGETCSVAIACESRVVAFRRSRERRWTHEEQLADYPDDTGFRFIAGLQDTQIIWQPAI